MKAPGSTWNLIGGGLLVVLLAGCSGGSGTAAAPGRPQVSASPSATATSPSPSPTGLTAQALPDVPVAEETMQPFTGPASDKFGADNVMAAYLFATDYALDAAFNGSLLALEEPRAIDFSAPEEAMTREAAARYRGLTEKVAAGTATEQEYENVLALSTWGIAGIGPEGSKVAIPAYRDSGFGGAGTAVGEAEGRDALVLTFPIKGQLLLTGPDGEPIQSELAKDMTLTLVQNPDPARPWLVADWGADYSIGEPIPDTAS